jgi:hypothetical protein
MSRRVSSGLALAALLCACADPVSVDQLAPALTQSTVSSQQYPSESEASSLVQYGFMEPTVTAWWSGATARVASHLSFFGNLATLATRLTLLREGSEVSSASTNNGVSGLIPIISSLSGSLERHADLTCGLTVEGSAQGHVEIRVLGLGTTSIIVIFSLDDGTTSSSSQPSCPPPAPGDGPPYDGQCQVCLEWTWYVGSVEVDSEWRCSSPAPCPAS